MKDALAELAKAANLTSRMARRWEILSAAVVNARVDGRPTSADGDLLKESSRLEGHPLGVAYLSWHAENLLHAGHPRRAITELDKAIEAAGKSSGPEVPFDPVVTLLRLRAEAARMTRDPHATIAAAVDLSDGAICHPSFDLQVAETAEWCGQEEVAEKWYLRTLAATEKVKVEDYRVRATVEDTPQHYREVARRGLQRLREGTDAVQSADSLAQALAEALEETDFKGLKSLASRTHFRIELGCHAAFVETEPTLELLFRSLSTMPPASFKLVANGEHRRLELGIAEPGHPLHHGALMLRRYARGWEWVGLRVGDFDYWVPDFPRAPKETNEALAIPIRGPWLAGRKFMAGGFRHPWHGIAAFLSLDPVGSTIRACSSDCGFGFRGLYYNEALSHNGTEAFAIDFSSYQRCLPHVDRANLWPVLAPADGLVTGTRIWARNGQERAANTVELIHPPMACRYLSRYLHLAGSPAIPVSAGMFVRAGAVLGFMDDTGNSSMPHLHFSIHDQSLGPHPDLVTSSVSAPIMFGPSVRPTPMAGQRLDDADDGRCVDSFNTGVRPRVRVR